LRPNDRKDRTKNVTLRIIKFFDFLPKTTAGHLAAKQLVRAGTSAGANYRAEFRGQRQNFMGSDKRVRSI